MYVVFSGTMFRVPGDRAGKIPDVMTQSKNCDLCDLLPPSPVFFVVGAILLEFIVKLNF